MLPGHGLRFHKRGLLDGSGKCDIVPARHDDEVWGVLYRIRLGDRRELDRIEGVGAGYAGRYVTVLGPHGPRRAYTYRATHDAVDAGLRPFCWYHAYVVAGARQHGLPEPYLQRLHSIDVLEDPDAERRTHHWGRLTHWGRASNGTPPLFHKPSETT